MKATMTTLTGMLWAGLVHAQVTNDDCANAMLLQPPNGSGQCTTFSLPGFAPMLLDSTDNALANFPYPIGTLNCEGYSGYVLGPANDMWFKAIGRWGYGWAIESSDTCHVTIWSGGGCTNLQALFCYAIANGSASGTLCGFQPLIDTIYMQVSNRALGSAPSNFSICFTSACPPFAGSSFDYSMPTPTLCFAHTVTSVACTDMASSDGEIHVAVTAGNGPFTIIWDDGSVLFDRVGLGIGTYSGSITDALGCSEDVAVLLDASTNIQEGVINGSIYFLDRSAAELWLPRSEMRGEGAWLVTVTGTWVVQARMIGDRYVLRTDGLAAGTYFLLQMDHSVPKYVGRVNLH